MKLDARVLALASALAAGGCAAPPETTIPHTEEAHYTSQAEHERVSPRITPINVADDGTGVYEVGPVGFTQRSQFVEQMQLNENGYDRDKDTKNTIKLQEARGTPLYTVQASMPGSTPESAIEALIATVSDVKHYTGQNWTRATSDLDTGSHSTANRRSFDTISWAGGVDLGEVTVHRITYNGEHFGFLAKGAEITVYGGQE